MPTATNTANYIKALKLAFQNMGPYEWTSNVTVLSRGYRHPIPGIAWPYSLNAIQLRAIENAGQEVENAQWLYRSQIVPAIPGTAGPPFTGPSIMVPRNVAFYAE
jgi:hypothetical protein